ncbi:4-hydroxy-tetrahydrodipicolinate reductase [Thermaurantiacus sp.]
MANASLRIGILGVGGRMGQALVAGIAARPDMVLAGGVERPGHPACGQTIGEGLIVCANAAPVAHKADVLIDFTSPAALPETLRAAEDAGCALVVGTTGLDPSHHAAIDRAARSIPILQAPNMALGVNLLAALVEKVAALLDPEWDIEIVELHHRAKRDAPSGTALHLAEAAARGRGAPLSALRLPPPEGAHVSRRPGGIGLASLRGGTAAGDHQVMFLGKGERLILSHVAESREIFAQGALLAARWLAGRPPGRFRMADLLTL